MILKHLETGPCVRSTITVGRARTCTTVPRASLNDGSWVGTDLTDQIAPFPITHYPFIHLLSAKGGCA